jgi:hypothetical protein
MRYATFSIIAVVTLAGCGRKGARSSDFDSATAAALATGTAATQMSNVAKVPHIAGFDIGHGLDRHDMIFGGVATQFKVGDSVLVSAKGLYLAAGADVSARIRLKNATLDSMGAKAGTPDTNGFTYVGLRFASGKKWTKGTYSVELFLDGKFQMAQDFTYTP